MNKLKLVLTTLLAAMGVGLSSPVSAQDGTTTTSMELEYHCQRIYVPGGARHLMPVA